MGDHRSQTECLLDACHISIVEPRRVPGRRIKNTGEMFLSGVSILVRFHTGKFLVGDVAERLNLECTEQNSADEHEHGAHS
jgi:hypothetical protein